MVMTISTLLTVVCDFKANAIGVGEEGCPIVGRILWVELCFRGFDTDRTQLVGNGDNISG